MVKITKQSYHFGDSVKITTKNEIIEGIILRRPQLLEGDFVVLKLGNGYNIGIEQKKIKKIEVIKPYTPKSIRPKKIPIRKDLPTISILSFGGTISSKIDYRTGAVHADYTAEDFLAMIPELREIANIRARKVISIMSEDFTYEAWKLMAEAVIDEFDSGVDGIVLTQGTDTLHFSSAIMGFFLKDLPKPVIFTAAQRSIDRGSSDAFMNLLCAVRAATFDVAEVLTCLHGSSSDDYCLLIRGSKVRKMHTSRRDAFRPINEKPIARIYEDGKVEILNKVYKKRSQQKAILDTNFEEMVAMVYIYPGIQSGIIDYYIKEGYKGIVIAATALGHVPTESKDSLVPALKRAIEKGIPVIIASQTIYGRVHPFVYTNLRRLSVETKCIFVENMLPETAFVKLGWILGKVDGKDLEKVKSMMLQNISGELNDRTEYDTFLF